MRMDKVNIERIKAEKKENGNEVVFNKIENKEGHHQKPEADREVRMAETVDINNSQNSKIWKEGSFKSTKDMYYGTEVNGKKTLGLKDLSRQKINPEYREQNIKQQSGYAAEIIGTYKENMNAQRNGSDIRTYRADDLPEKYGRNDPYVDKVRVNSKGEIVERVQTKFVGNNGKECLAKLMSKKYDKYFDDGKVDKLEIPKEFYDEIRKEKLIENKISKLEEQLARVTAEGKTEVANSIRSRIERCKKIDKMLERSTVSRDEAIYARKHPKRFIQREHAKDIFQSGHDVGKQTALCAAAMTVIEATVDNTSQVVKGEKTPEEAAKDIAKKTAKSGMLGYGTGWVNGAVAREMSQSSYKLIRNMGDLGVPAAIVSVAVDCYDSVNDFAHGIINSKELAYDIGESVSSVGGSAIGSAIGASVGCVVPVVGTAIGSIVGGMIGCAVTSQAYKTAVKHGVKGSEVLANKAQQYANDTIKTVEKEFPYMSNNVKKAFRDYAKENEIPIKV